jgi:hypothetical protein
MARITISPAGGGASTTAASQAQMEAATDNAVMVTPANAQWHHGMAKAWIKCNASGAIQGSHNVTSITDNGTGALTVTIATDFSGATYSCVVSANASGTGFVLLNVSDPSAAGSTFIECRNATAAAAADPINYFAAWYGDQ